MLGGDISVPINLGNIITFLMGGLLWFVWNSLNEKIARQERDAREGIERLQREFNNIPQRLDRLMDLIQKLQLDIARLEEGFGSGTKNPRRRPSDHNSANGGGG